MILLKRGMDTKISLQLQPSGSSRLGLDDLDSWIIFVSKCGNHVHDTDKKCSVKPKKKYQNILEAEEQ